MHCKLAHDTRNGLTTIIGLCELSMGKLPPEDSNATCLRQIAATAWHLAEALSRHQCEVSAALLDERASHAPPLNSSPEQPFHPRGDFLAVLRRDRPF